MNVITLNIYTNTAEHEILEFLKKFKPQEAEIRQETVVSTANNVRAHPFFGMMSAHQETVEETISRLRGTRY